MCGERRDERAAADRRKPGEQPTRHERPSAGCTRSPPAQCSSPKNTHETTTAKGQAVPLLQAIQGVPPRYRLSSTKGASTHVGQEKRHEGRAQRAGELAGRHVVAHVALQPGHRGRQHREVEHGQHYARDDPDQRLSPERLAPVPQPPADGGTTPGAPTVRVAHETAANSASWTATSMAGTAFGTLCLGDGLGVAAGHDCRSRRTRR